MRTTPECWDANSVLKLREADVGPEGEGVSVAVNGFADSVVPGDVWLSG